MIDIEQVREKAKSETNIIKAQYYIIVLYTHWFLTTWTGRFLMATVIIGALMVNIMLHEINPSARMNAKQKIKMEKLESELSKNSSNLPKNEMIDTWNHSMVTWRSKDYENIYNKHLKILDDMRILKNEAFVQNGFASWQNRLMNALPRIWVLNDQLKKLEYNEHIKYNIRHSKAL